MSYVFALLGLITGAALGYLRGRKQDQNRLLELEKNLVRLETENQLAEKRILEQKQHGEQRLREHQEEVSKLQAQSQTLFENIGNRILEQNTRRFAEQTEKLTEQNTKNLQGILAPLREKIGEFEKKVSDSYNNESRERFALKEELKRIVELNQQMTIEATNLTRALKADVKQQGNWGELILERLLMESGLREGLEYILEGEGMKLKTAEGDHQRPDVIIRLPDEKHIIVDSKVSLKSYEAFCSGQSDKDRARALKSFVDSVKRHVDGLSAKHYESLEGVRSPDFVLLFMPLEPAFALALQSDAGLVPYAWGKKVAFVSPTTLLATLGTVASLWKTERQNRNALEIARLGGSLYDKFVGFVSDLDKIGKNIEDTRRSYDEAFNKLRDGRGNLMVTAEKMRNLGAKASKSLDVKLVPEDLEP
ncbi:MAG: DNA recombination protein RmuC [Bdellovibrionales bacterium]|nr:DNA recombination protein RmuC [Bdellovibrionales bacterium]